MSDLISRQAFLDFIESVPFLLEHQNFKGIVIDWIKQQPTAYNPDKVVEQLEEAKDDCVFIRATTEANSYCEALNKAKKIVKGGGISE